MLVPEDTRAEMAHLRRQMDELGKRLEDLSHRMDRCLARLEDALNGVKPPNVNPSGKAEGDKSVQKTGDTVFAVDEELEDRMSSNCPQ